MADDLQWFKFSPGKWMTGRIRKEKEKIQSAFVVLVCQYWKERCSMTVEKARDEIGDSLDVLVKKKIVKVSDDFIKISFLDEQMIAIGVTSEQKSKAAKAKWEKEKAKKMQMDAGAMHVHKGAMQIDADKTREEKTREDFNGDWIDWGNLIVEKRDQHWDAMRGRKVSQDEMDAFLSVATRNKWQMDTQQEFRISLKGFRVNGSHEPEQKNKYKTQ